MVRVTSPIFNFDVGNYTSRTAKAKVAKLTCNISSACHDRLTQMGVVRVTWLVLANVNSYYVHVRSMLSPVRLSSVC